MGIPLEAAEFDGRRAMALLEGLGVPLAALAEAQGQGDWVTVADVLEFDLEPALGTCEPFFTGLADLARQAAPAH
jgi:hypothetical protein